MASEKAVRLCWCAYMACNLWLWSHEAPSFHPMLHAIGLRCLEQGGDGQQTNAAAEHRQVSAKAQPARVMQTHSIAKGSMCKERLQPPPEVLQQVVRHAALQWAAYVRNVPRQLQKCCNRWYRHAAVQRQHTCKECFDTAPRKLVTIRNRLMMMMKN